MGARLGNEDGRGQDDTNGAWQQDRDPANGPDAARHDPASASPQPATNATQEGGIAF
jgi:hypothetical protein